MSTRNIAGRQLGQRYTLLTLIAQGGMGEVWKARDQQTGSLVAAKVLRPELTGEEISLSRLRLEAENAMRAKHPNIAAVLDSGEDDGQGWIIMELVDGEPLTNFLGDGRRLSEQELIPLLIQTSYALDAAARADVVHRDIKPANIMIRPDGLVKLTDFGVSLAAGQANLTAAGMVMGTAQYLPPEQAMGQVATAVGDLYGLGVIAFEALTGRRPYTGKSQVDIAFAHVNDPIPTLPDTVSQPMADLVYNLLSKEPAQRPQTGAALARRLVVVAGQLGLGTNPVPLHAPTPVKGVVAGGAEESATPAPVVVAPVHHVTREHFPASAIPAATSLPVPSAAPTGGPTWRRVGSEQPTMATPMQAGKSAPPEPESSKVGLAIIVALVVLTLVLIVIAMIRNNSNEVSTSSPAAAVQLLPEFQEVEPWLTPTRAV